MFTAVTIQNAAGTDVALFDTATGRRLSELTGLHGLPAPRRVVRVLPGGAGEINETSQYASRQPVLTGQLTGADATAVWALYDTILTALWGAVSEERLLKWTRAGKQFQTSVKIGDALPGTMRATDAGRVLPYQLVFDREDPRNYSQATHTVVGASLSDIGGGDGFPDGFPDGFGGGGQSGLVSAVNTGTIETPGVFTIVGQASNARIQQVSTGKLIALNGDLGAGSTLVVDAHERDRTVLLDGLTDRGDLIDFAATDWTAGLIPAGGGDYRLLATSWSAAAHLEITTHDAYA